MKRILTLLAVFLLVSACGQKGTLYLTEETPDKPQTQESEDE
jgi:predicted small lipoprotein YifL